jgi:hypothetical protein
MKRLSIEEVESIYLDENYIKEPPYKLRRMDYHGSRYYYREINGENRFYMSVTTMIKKALPTSPFLIKWIADMGIDAANEFAKMRADYGTIMHIAFAKLALERTFNLDQLENFVAARISEECPNRLSRLTEWVEELEKDILAFAQFMIECKVKVKGVELMVCSDRLQLAGAVDMYVEMTLEEMGFHGEVYKADGKHGKKGDPKRTKGPVTFDALIDFKSGKKGFYEENEIQLGAYRELMTDNFATPYDMRIFNFAPNAWRDAPTYKLKEQSESKNLAKLPHLVELQKIESSKKRSVLVTRGKINLDNPTGIKNNYSYLELDDAIKATPIGGKPKGLLEDEESNDLSI